MRKDLLIVKEHSCDSLRKNLLSEGHIQGGIMLVIDTFNSETGRSQERQFESGLP